MGEYKMLEQAVHQRDRDLFFHLMDEGLKKNKGLEAEYFGMAQGMVLAAGTGQKQCLRSLKEFENNRCAAEYLAELLEGTAEPRKKLVPWVKTYIDDHLSEEISMAEVANYLNLNYSYFSRMFSRYAGNSFSGYVFERRMQTARQRLNAGERVTDVASLVGYREVKSFSRAFHRRFGIAPSICFIQKRVEDGERYAAENRVGKMETYV